METSNIEIHAHDNDVEVAHKINTMELHNWINHLTYVSKELKNLITFFNSQPTEIRLEREKVSQRFEMILVDNDVILSQLLSFKNTRTSIIECQDMQCDMSFIQEHEKCRRMYQFHIEKYRKLKDAFFAELQNNINKQALSA